MKQFSYIILLLSLFLTGCESDDNSGKSLLDLGIQEVTFEASGGNQEVTVPLDGNWLATSDKNWCTLEKDGQKLMLKAPLNLTIAPRTAVITVSEGNGEGSFTVVQAGSQFNVFPEKIYISSSGQRVPLLIQGNVGWQAQADEIWCHTNIQDGQLLISADTYKEEKSARYAQVTIQVDGQVARIIPVIQIHRKNFNLEKWSDTNLGATLAATPENLTGKQYKKTWGNYYQWGRNTGFSSLDPTSIVPLSAKRDISAAQAQEMTEFITATDDWLIDGSLTCKLPSAENPYNWMDRAGSNPCPSGYRLPKDYESNRIFASSDLLFKDKIRQEGKEILDAIGTEYDFVSVGNGASTLYIIKMYGTPEAYVMRYEFKGIVGYNGWFKITEIKGNTDTDFQTPEEAAALFAKATESAERCFPICGTLWCENAELVNSGTCAYWTQVPSFLFTGAANVIILANNFIGYAPSYRRALGCMIRGIKE